MKIKTWQERLYLGYEEDDKIEAMQEEINELRAEVERLTQKSIEDSWRINPERMGR